MKTNPTMPIFWVCPNVFFHAKPYRFSYAQKQRVGLRLQSIPAIAIPHQEKDFRLRPHTKIGYRNKYTTYESGPI